MRVPLFSWPPLLWGLCCLCPQQSQALHTPQVVLNEQQCQLDRHLSDLPAMSDTKYNKSFNTVERVLVTGFKEQIIDNCFKMCGLCLLNHKANDYSKIYLTTAPETSHKTLLTKSGRSTLSHSKYCIGQDSLLFDKSLISPMCKMSLISIEHSFQQGQFTI